MTDDRAGTAAPTSNRRVRTAWLLCLVALHAFFYQGGGWNQNARFDTMRALAERGSYEITAYAANTGDVVEHEGRIFANKPPGHALLGAPFYFVLFQIEQWVGLSADDPGIANANASVLTWLTAGLPSVALAWMLAIAFRRRGGTPRESLLVASAFATGSLLFPYAGMLMAHNLTAALLFAAWLSITAQRSSRASAALAGLALGWAVLSEFLAAPAAALLVGYGIWRERDPKQIASLLAGPLVCAAILVAHNLACFGEPFTTPYTAASAGFKTEGLWLGVFDWPDPMRLYWLTLHPFRGLLYCCPVFLVPLFAIFRARNWKRPAPESLLAGAIVATFVLFNLCFNGWTGGWGVGPRYLIPALPFLFLPALAGWQRLPRTAAAISVLSTSLMFCVAATLVMVPGPNTGVAVDFDPVWYTMRVLAMGSVSVNSQSISEPYPTEAGNNLFDSWNLGEVMGLTGWASLLPALALVVAIYGYAGSPWTRGRSALAGRAHGDA